MPILKEGSQFRDVLNDTKAYPIEKPHKPLEGINDFKYEVRLRLTLSLVRGNEKIGKNLGQQLETIAYENGRLEGFGAPSKKIIKDTEQFKRATEKYLFAQPVGLLAVVMAKDIGYSDVQEAYNRGVEEGRLEFEAPVVDKTYRNVSYDRLHELASKAAKTHKKAGEEAVTFMEHFVFPTYHDTKERVHRYRRVLDVRDAFRAARYCADQSKQTQAIFDDMEKALFELPTKKKTSNKLKTDPIFDRALFITEPISTELTGDVFIEKVLNAIGQSGLYGDSIQNVSAILGQRVDKLFHLKGKEFYSPQYLLRQLCFAATNKNVKEHRFSRALLDAINVMFPKKEFRALEKSLGGFTFESVHNNFMNRILRHTIEVTKTYDRLTKDKKGSVVRKTTRDTAIFLSPDRTDIALTIKPGTPVVVDQEDEKRNDKLVRVYVDEVPYYVAKSSLDKVSAKEKSTRRNTEKKKKTEKAKAKSKKSTVIEKTTTKAKQKKKK